MAPPLPLPRLAAVARVTRSRSADIVPQLETSTRATRGREVFTVQQDHLLVEHLATIPRESRSTISSFKRFAEDPRCSNHSAKSWHDHYRRLAVIFDARCDELTRSLSTSSVNAVNPEGEQTRSNSISSHIRREPQTSIPHPTLHLKPPPAPTPFEKAIFGDLLAHTTRYLTKPRPLSEEDKVIGLSLAIDRLAQVHGVSADAAYDAWANAGVGGLRAADQMLRLRAKASDPFAQMSAPLSRHEAALPTPEASDDDEDPIMMAAQVVVNTPAEPSVAPAKPTLKRKRDQGSEASTHSYGTRAQSKHRKRTMGVEVTHELSPHKEAAEKPSNLLLKSQVKFRVPVRDAADISPSWHHFRLDSQTVPLHGPPPAETGPISCSPVKVSTPTLDQVASARSQRISPKHVQAHQHRPHTNPASPKDFSTMHTNRNARHHVPFSPSAHRGLMSRVLDGGPAARRARAPSVDSDDDEDYGIATLLQLKQETRAARLPGSHARLHYTFDRTPPTVGLASASTTAQVR
ncbi:hypothetical protein MIND_01331100 [Mycena indigotica]|uniref:Uncharacterized protein n=1 Tax=Mycena indigotica TaxID=2126181 RepID=A0A8H6VQC3_9AGAR|nr:uncharacterized protein MIND_01331100 [Mycena indigotica]KAF7290177.1 hypothetical protein MIND_01331100 [Mycena indigotica]